MFLITLILMVLSYLNHAKFNLNDISTWLNYDITDFNSDNIKSIIVKASNDLKHDGSFIITDFLTPSLKDLIATELKSVQHIPRKTTRTVFQDKGDFIHFDTTSPRNFMLENSMEFVSRMHIEQTESEDYKSYLISLYNYPQILELWRKIINSTELYLSQDKAGSVYGFYGKPNDWFSMHFDESPFSCIYMIEKPEKGGFFRYIVMDNPIKNETIDNNIYDKWEELGIVLNNEENVKDRIKSIHVNEGDVYCMFGNQTLHEVTKIQGNKDRSVFVMTYGNTLHFEHTSNVHNLNKWNVDDKKAEL
eukprot:326976_1